MKTSLPNEESVMEFEMSSGNVFADLGFDRPEEMQLKSKLVIQINLIINERDLDEMKIEKILNIDENTRTKLTAGRLTELSIEQLFCYLNILGKDLEIVLKPTARSQERGHLKVTIV
jgi:predicted XRE-type DNA-binding protein